MRNVNVTLIIIFLSLKIVFSQENDFVQYDTDHGLASTFVTDICKDPNGFIWLTTIGGGISKFNGLTFENYSKKLGLEKVVTKRISTNSRNCLLVLSDSSFFRIEGGISTEVCFELR